MVQSFNNQVMFGHREWAILAENNKPMPVGLDNKPMIDKPLQKQLRKPSEVKEEKPDDSIVGYMGDDEDVQQAQYNVMTLVNDTVGGLNNHIERINKELQILIGRNTNEIKGLKGELCVPFMKENCDNEKTVEGCMECAEYYRGKFRLPEDCSVAVLNNHCNFKNTYSPGSAPPDIGDTDNLRDKIRESPPRLCKEYGHFDCKVMTDQDRLGNSIPLFSRENKKCIWKENELSKILKLRSEENLSMKCRNFCSNYDQDQRNCDPNHCYYSDEGKCYEKICELRMSSPACSHNEEATSYENVCGYSNHTEDKGYFEVFMDWIKSSPGKDSIGFHVSLDGGKVEDHILPNCRSAENVIKDKYTHTNSAGDTINFPPDPNCRSSPIESETYDRVTNYFYNPTDDIINWPRLDPCTGVHLPSSPLDSDNYDTTSVNQTQLTNQYTCQDRFKTTQGIEGNFRLCEGEVGEDEETRNNDNCYIGGNSLTLLHESLYDNLSTTKEDISCNSVGNNNNLDCRFYDHRSKYCGGPDGARCSNVNGEKILGDTNWLNKDNNDTTDTNICIPRKCSNIDPSKFSSPNKACEIKFNINENLGKLPFWTWENFKEEYKGSILKDESVCNYNKKTDKCDYNPKYGEALDTIKGAIGEAQDPARLEKDKKDYNSSLMKSAIISYGSAFLLCILIGGILSRFIDDTPIVIAQGIIVFIVCVTFTSIRWYSGSSPEYKLPYFTDKSTYKIFNNTHDDPEINDLNKLIVDMYGAADKEEEDFGTWSLVGYTVLFLVVVWALILFDYYAVFNGGGGGGGGVVGGVRDFIAALRGSGGDGGLGANPFGSVSSAGSSGSDDGGGVAGGGLIPQVDVLGTP